MKKKIILGVLTIIVAFVIGLFLFQAKTDYTQPSTTTTGNKSDTEPLTFNTSDQTGFIFKYADGSGFSIRPPEPVSDWIFDTAALRGQGIAVTFYKKGSTFDKSPVIIYVRRHVYSERAGKDLQDLIKKDEALFKGEYTDMKISELSPLTTESGSQAFVVSYTTDSYPRYEKTAYLDADGAGDIIVISAKTKDDFVKMSSTFDNFLKSYKYLPEVKNK